MTSQIVSNLLKWLVQKTYKFPIGSIVYLKRDTTGKIVKREIVIEKIGHPTQSRQKQLYKVIGKGDEMESKKLYLVKSLNWDSYSFFRKKSMKRFKK